MPRNPHLVEGASFGISIVKDFKLGDRLLKNVDRLQGIIDEKDVGGTEIGERQGLAAVVVKFAENGESFVQALHTFLLVVEREIRQAHIIQGGAASSFVRRWINAQRVTIIPICLLRESPTSVDVSDMCDGGGFMFGVAELMPDGTSRLEFLDGSLLLAERVVGACNGSEDVRLGFAVAGFARLLQENLKR